MLATLFKIEHEDLRAQLYICTSLKKGVDSKNKERHISNQAPVPLLRIFIVQ